MVSKDAISIPHNPQHKEGFAGSNSNCRYPSVRLLISVSAHVQVSKCKVASTSISLSLSTQVQFSTCGSPTAVPDATATNWNLERKLASFQFPTARSRP